ncbi:MAG: Hsp70 family protein [Polyangiales bacterium]
MQTIGIDLGTTNTVAASNGKVLALPLSGEPGSVLPSVVAHLPSGETQVGHAARRRYGIDPKNTLCSAKRVIGETLQSAAARDFAAHYPFDLAPTADGLVGFRTRAGIFSPGDVATLVLRGLCRQAAIEPASFSAVVTVPAAFGPARRQATLRAVTAAGFAGARCVAEPIATAIAYLDRTRARYAAVYDLGGGTFDLAIVDCSEELLRVVAHDGDVYLGGDDIDRAIARWAADHVLRERGWDLRSDPEVFARLTLEAERAKIRLSETGATLLNLEGVDAAAPALPPLELDRLKLWQVSAALIKRTFVVCDDVLARASLTVRDLDAVFLAGGATLLPGVRDAVGEYFGHKLRHDLDPLHAVSIGASLAAARPRLSSLLA